MRDRFPKYTLKMRGEAVRIIQEGYPDRVFDLPGLWEEYRRVSFPNEEDSTRRYVIERAIETLKRKSPQFWQKRKGAKVAGRWVDRWAALPARQMGRAPRSPRKKSLSRLFLDWIRGL